jgi:hypothetical protein
MTQDRASQPAWKLELALNAQVQPRPRLQHPTGEIVPYHRVAGLQSQWWLMARPRNRSSLPSNNCLRTSDQSVPRFGAMADG